MFKIYSNVYGTFDKRHENPSRFVYFSPSRHIYYLHINMVRSSSVCRTRRLKFHNFFSINTPLYRKIIPALYNKNSVNINRQNGNLIDDSLCGKLSMCKDE